MEEGRGAGAQESMGLEGYGRCEKREKRGRQARSPRGRDVGEKFKGKCLLNFLLLVMLSTT